MSMSRGEGQGALGFSEFRGRGGGDGVGKVAGFSPHAGVAARLHCGSSLRVSTMGRCRGPTELTVRSCPVSGGYPS